MIASTTEFANTHDGKEQLRRRWRPEGDVRAAMLIVHGMGEHSGRYEHVGATFAGVGIDVLAFDQRGYGRSAGPRGHVDDFAHFIDDVEPLLADRRGTGVPVVLLGHSLGGLVATTYLVSERPQPDVAVLSAPALAADVPSWQRIAAPALGTIIPKLKIPADFDGAVLSRDPDVQDAYENDPLRVSASTARLGREVFSAMTAARDAIDRLRVPTYVLHGSADTLVPPSASEFLADHPRVERRVWEGLRHECLNEPEQDEVMAAVVDWIDDRLS